MYTPKNPKNIVIKNKFYPNGLNEIKIWEYYQSYKKEILEQTKNRQVMIFIILEDKSQIVRKKWNNKPIYLTNSNYDNILSGRSISIHSLMKKNEDIAIIDIDGDNFLKVKKLTKDIFKLLSGKISFIKNCEIRYTGKTGFHIKCYLQRKNDINVIRKILYKILSASNLTGKYTIKSKRSPGIPNIDLYSNKVSGGYICLNSLSTIGLRCIEVKYDKIDSFIQSISRI